MSGRFGARAKEDRWRIKDGLDTVDDGLSLSDQALLLFHVRQNQLVQQRGLALLLEGAWFRQMPDGCTLSRLHLQDHSFPFWLQIADFQTQRCVAGLGRLIELSGD